jgi:hypothetical protein
MTDHERNRQRDHWQAIAEQLGLARDAEPAEPEHEAGHERATPAPPPAERADEPEEMITAQGADQQETVFSTEDSDQARAVDVPETLTEVQDEDVDAPSEESDAQHGRRRGRRRRGGKSRRRNEEKVNEPGERGISRAGDSTLEEGEEDLPRGPRRRGRGHERIDEAEAEAEAADLPAPETIEQEADDDTEIEELGDFSNWNVPSWNELIASLYRPER